MSGRVTPLWAGVFPAENQRLWQLTRERVGERALPAAQQRAAKQATGRRLVLAACLLFTGCSVAVDAVVLHDFEAAQQAFAAAQTPTDYLHAAALYQRIVDRGVRSGAVYFNQGNAFMRAHERGRALACYRLAQRYRPRDPFLQANLAHARRELATPDRRFWWEYLAFWQNWFSYPAKATAAAAAAIIAWATAIWAVWTGRVFPRRIAWTATGVTALAIFSTAHDWYRFDYLQHGVVTVADAIARKGNGLAYEPALDQPLREGAEFLVRRQTADWLLVELPGRLRGWLRRSDVVVY